MREPESQETFDESFSFTEFSTGSDVEARANKAIADCKREAAELAAKWLLRRGYFNGEITGTVFMDNKERRCDVAVTLTCYGLVDR